MKKRIHSIRTLTAALMTLALLTAQSGFSAAAEEMSSPASDRAFDMAEHSDAQAHIFSVMEEGTLEEALLETLNLYIKTRERAFSEQPAAQVLQYQANMQDCTASAAVLTKEAERAGAYDYLAEREIYVADCASQAYIEAMSPAGTNRWVLNVYEWTWLDYSGERGRNTDQMGFGTDHILVVEKKSDGNYSILDDQYDDSEITGAGASVQTSADELVWQETIEAAEITASTASANYNALNVEAVVAYADEYVMRYASGTNNSSYYNSAYGYIEGNDCANYVSQCLKAGGLPENTNWKWNGKTGTTPNATKSWKGSISLYRQLSNETISAAQEAESELDGTKRCLYTAMPGTASNIFPGNPVWCYADRGHVGICVGYNSSGVPIINAHTKDRYHYPYTQLSPNTYTVQVVTYNKWGSTPTSANSLTITTTNQSVTTYMYPQVSLWYKFTAPAAATYTFYSTNTQNAGYGVQATLYEAVQTGGMSAMNEVAYDNNGGGSGNFWIEEALTAGKVYYLRIYADTYGSSGTISLWYKRN